MVGGELYMCYTELKFTIPHTISSRSTGRQVKVDNTAAPKTLYVVYDKKLYGTKEGRQLNFLLCLLMLPAY